MPVFVEDPAQFSKQRLKLELVAHNVPLPAGESKKQVYLDLYLKYIAKNKAADFSSDEEDQAQEDAVEPSVSQEEEGQQNEELDKMDVTQLTDDELKAEFQKYGVKVGPIVASTRALYERKLQRLLDPAPQPKQNGTSNADQYSDSEEEDDESGCDCEHPGPEPAAVTVTESDQSQLRDSRVGMYTQEDDSYYYPQCFLPSSRMRVKREPTEAAWDSEPQRNPGRGFDFAAERSRELRFSSASAQSSTSSAGVAIPTGLGVKQACRPLAGSRSASPCTSTSWSTSRSFSITQMVEELERRSPRSDSRAAMESSSSRTSERRPAVNGHADARMMDKYTMTNGSPLITARMSLFKQQFKPMKDVLTEMFPDADRTPTGISATRRRPIKGAAGRPVQFKYPDLPMSPRTVEQQELQQRLVPLWVQVVVFLVVAALLFLIYGAMEDSLANPFSALLDNLSQEAELIEDSSSLPDSLASPDAPPLPVTEGVMGTPPMVQGV